jgi:hypothetical protein
MTQITKIVDEAAAQVASALDQAQDATVAVVGQVTGSVGLGTTPSDIVASGFDVSKKVVSAGFEATSQILGRVLGQEQAKPAAKTV